MSAGAKACATPSAAAATSAASRSAGILHVHPDTRLLVSINRITDLPLAQKFFAVQLVDCVIGVAVVIEFNESKAIFHKDLPDTTVAFEKLLYVPFPHIIWQAAHIHTSSHL